MLDKKNSEELLAETRTPKVAYEYAIRREKEIEHNNTIKYQNRGQESSSGYAFSVKKELKFT